jgi:hypothetical protein
VILLPNNGPIMILQEKIGNKMFQLQRYGETQIQFLKNGETVNLQLVSGMTTHPLQKNGQQILFDYLNIFCLNDVL